MAANSSMMFLNTFCKVAGRKSWVRKMATVTPKTPPIIRAKKELYKVPQIWGRMPNFPLLASQVWDRRKSGPYLLMAGRASLPISNKI